MITQEFWTIGAAAELRTNIKGSWFISYCMRTPTVAEAMAFIQSIRAKHADATHNCWAYRISPNEYRFSDDGEPGGTAGQPILQTLIGANLTQVSVVVTRYYGGVKLGAGGLVRAYGGGAAAVLKSTEIVLIRPTKLLELTVAFAEQHNLYHFLGNYPDVTISSTEYIATGLKVVVQIYLSDETDFIPKLRDSLRGRVEVINN